MVENTDTDTNTSTPQVRRVARRTLPPQEDQTLMKISDKQVSTDAYHQIMKCAAEFTRMSANTPKALLHVVQHIHGSLDNAAACIYKCGNKKDLHKKLELLEEAEEELQFLYNRLDYLYHAKAVTLGQANEFVSLLKEAYVQVDKWHTSTLSRSEAI